MEHFSLFSSNSSGHLRLDAYQSQIIEEDAEVDHTQTNGRGYSQIIGRDIPPIPHEFWHPSFYHMFQNFALKNLQ